MPLRSERQALPLSQPAEFRDEKLYVTVVFTSADATAEALKRAGELANGLGARIRLLVAQVVPYPLELDHPDIDPLFKPRQLWRFPSAAPDIEVSVRLCRDMCACIEQSLPQESIVVIGGRRGWWPTREGRLARNLRASGRQVIFVPLCYPAGVRRLPRSTRGRSSVG